MHPRSAVRRVLCLAVVVLASGCEFGTEPRREGLFEGSWGGTRFVGTASASVVGDSLYIVGDLPTGEYHTRWLVIALGGVRGPGEYAIGPGGARIRYLEGGDGIWASYQTTQPGAGRVRITSTSGAAVTGHVRFVADVQPGQTPVGESAVFEAEFRAPVDAQRLRELTH